MIFTYDITKLKADLEGMMHGTTLNQITNLYGLINRAASQLLLDCDPQETIRIVPIINAVYSQVFDYPLPVDIKGNRIINLFPQVQQYKRGNAFTQQYNAAFNWSKNWQAMSSLSMLFNSGIKTIQISWINAQTGTLVNPADETDDNGEWNPGGTASNVINDNVNFVAGNGSISFDLAAGSDPSVGYLENTTSESVDLSNVADQSVLFLYTYLPNGSNFDSVELRWGSSSSDYYSQTATLTQQNTAFQNGWNLLAFPWVSASSTGTPDPSSITYLRVTWNYDGTQQTAVRLDNIVSRLGSILNIEYYSKYLFSNPTTGAFQERVLTDSDLVNLDTESYTLLLYLVAVFAAQQQSGSDSGFDSSYFFDLYQSNLLRYTTMYKSQVMKPHTVYYKAPLRNLRRYFRGGGW